MRNTVLIVEIIVCVLLCPILSPGAVIVVGITVIIFTWFGFNSKIYDLKIDIKYRNKKNDS